MSADEIKKIEAEEVKTEAAEDKIMNAKSGSSSEMISESKATKVEASAMNTEVAPNTETIVEKFSGDSTQTKGSSITSQSTLDANTIDIGNTEPSIWMPSTVIASTQQDQNMDKMTVEVTSSKENGQEHKHNASKDVENEVKTKEGYESRLCSLVNFPSVIGIVQAGTAMRTRRPELTPSKVVLIKSVEEFKGVLC
jgi:hypothetical protein